MGIIDQGTDFLKLPVGTTAQRPSVPASGMIRMNSTTGDPEWYDAITATWKKFSQPAGYSVNYLVVAGGGGAGGGSGGSGAGGNGGSGVVIFSVPTANYTGTTTGSPTITTSGANTKIKFTASGSYTA